MSHIAGRSTLRILSNAALEATTGGGRNPATGESISIKNTSTSSSGSTTTTTTSP